MESVGNGLAGLLLFDTTLQVGVDGEEYICGGTEAALLGVGGGEKTQLGAVSCILGGEAALLGVCGSKKTHAASCALGGEATIGRVLVLR